MADRIQERQPEAKDGGSNRKSFGGRGGEATKRSGTKPDGNGSTRRSSAKSGAGATAAAPRKAKPRTKQPEMKKDLRDFASARPHGWGHDDWLAFLESLKDRGHDIADREAIGRALERERLDLALTRIKGVGPQKRQALTERYGNLWDLQRAEVDELAAVGNIPRPLAERIKSEVQG